MINHHRGTDPPASADASRCRAGTDWTKSTQACGQHTILMGASPQPKYPLSKLKEIAQFLFLLLVLSIFPPADAKASLRRSAVVIAVERVSPAVVNISTTVQERVSPYFPFSGDDFFRDFFPDLFSREYTRTSLGSGVLIDGSKGFIITNHHVVAKATGIKVITSNQNEYKAEILGSDPRSDLAILQIKAKQKLSEITMGNSDDLMIGETVIAIGNPFGLSHTVTTGVVSALERSVRTEERIYRHLIQTDASINPGNSGGPLLNVKGELIGINTAIYQKAQGIGFAIPINKARRIVLELIRAGKVRFPWLGLEIQKLTNELKNYFGLREDDKGVLVGDVVDGSPAEKAGFKRGDILIYLEGTPILSLEHYRATLGEYTLGNSLKLRILRKGKELVISVKPAPFPLDYARELFYRRLGIKIEEADRKVHKQYELKEGIYIKEVRAASKAVQYGLRAGDLLLKINERPVKTLDEFNKAISEYRHLTSLTLIVQRGQYGYSLTLPF